jgi:hypothetical protein
MFFSAAAVSMKNAVWKFIDGFMLSVLARMQSFGVRWKFLSENCDLIRWDSGDFR